MYTLVKRLFVWWGLILVVSLLGPIMQEYMRMHPYYDQFLSGTALWQNLTILFLGLCCALIPIVYVAKSKKISFRSFILLLWLWLWLFATTYVGIKSDLFSGAWMKMLLNSWFLLWLAVLFFTQLVALGTRINNRFLHLSLHGSVTTFLFTLALWLVGFLSVEYVLLLLNIAFPLINRCVWWAGVYLVWLYSAELQEMWEWLMRELFVRYEGGIWWGWVIYFLAWLVATAFAIALFSWWQAQVRARFIAIIAVWFFALWMYETPSLSRDGWGIIQIFTLKWFADVALFVLLLLFVWYLYNWFVLAYIPYPTARDANHAYMFVPKMFALHNGYYRNEIAMRWFWWIRLSYITFWFSLFTPSQGFMWISADTIAIEMNFLSWLFVAIFGAGLVWSFVSVLKTLYKDASVDVQTMMRLLILLGIFFIFQWLSSGMWAFLVFIDNKTDMWVLTLIVAALLSWFLFFHEHLEEDTNTQKISPTLSKRLVLSGLFFAFAVLAKPTATFDVLNFFLLLRWSWFGILWVVALPLLALWWLALIEMRWVNWYFTSVFWWWMAALGWIGLWLDVFLQWYKKIVKYGKFLLLRWTSFLVIMVWAKLLYYIPDVLFYGNGDRGVTEWVQALLLGANSTSEKQNEKMLAQNGMVPPPALCSLQSEWLSDTAWLYKELKPIVWDGYQEDVGRYVWYGWKGNKADLGRGVSPFIDPWRARSLASGCHSFSPFFLDSSDAVVLCETEEDWKSFDLNRLLAVQNRLTSDWSAFSLIENLKKWVGTATVAELTSTHRPDILALEWIMQGEAMKIVEKTDANWIAYKEVFLPYKYLNFLNITFNWSLQNLSSYYTDIGIVRLLLIVFAGFWLIYGIVQRERFLITIHVVTLFWWLLRLVVWWGILWYGIGIIIWSILSFITLLYSLSRRTDSVFDVVFVGLFVAVFLYAWLWQGWYNMVRISTQGGGGPFMRYKTNYGTTQTIQVTNQGQITPVNSVTWRYGSDEVFSLQFPHYKKFLSLANERSDDAWVLIAGTYARYFIKNQRLVFNDQFLTELFQWFSDNNVCRSYLRLQDKWLRYLAIDPNIWTVVQGDGNKWLFERFFARLNPTSGVIEQHGTMSMLAALAQKWYIRYVSSNNIGAKYALTMPDSVFAGLSGDALTVMRAKMMVVRFFQEPQLMSNIVTLADQRVKDGMFFEDIADIMWLQVSPATTQKIVQWVQLNPTELTEDEKKALSQFFGLRQQLATNPTQYQQTLQSIVNQSLGAWNQIIVMEVVQ